MNKKEKKDASAGNRTRISCLEGVNANHYTTDAIGLLGFIKVLNPTDLLMSHKPSHGEKSKINTGSSIRINTLSHRTSFLGIYWS
jgi:hypothetical protein